MYTSIFFAAILALARVAIATPPACLIGVMGVQSNPADMKAICGTLQSAVAGNITQKCSANAEAPAISAYTAACASIGMKVVVDTSSSASATATGTSKSTGTAKTTLATATATDAGTGAVTTKGTSGTAVGAVPIPTSTNAAGTVSPQYAMAVLAAGFAGQYLL